MYVIKICPTVDSRLGGIPLGGIPLGGIPLGGIPPLTVGLSRNFQN
jgi:hypothetical protein